MSRQRTRHHRLHHVPRQDAEPLSSRHSTPTPLTPRDPYSEPRLHDSSPLPANGFSHHQLTGHAHAGAAPSSCSSPSSASSSPYLHQQHQHLQHLQQQHQHQRCHSADTRFLPHSVANLHHGCLVDSTGAPGVDQHSLHSLHSPAHSSAHSTPDARRLPNPASSYYVKTPGDVVFPFHAGQMSTPHVSTEGAIERALNLVNGVLYIFSALASCFA